MNNSPTPDKDAIEKEVREEVERIFQAIKAETDQEILLSGSCVWHAVAARRVLAKHLPDARVILQAGSMAWPCVTPEDDDGVSPTHFAYQWDPGSPDFILGLIRGDFPECHVWNAVIPKSGKPMVVDFSAKYHRENCRLTQPDMKWTAPDPPGFVWYDEDSIPEGVCYTPSASAVQFIITMLCSKESAYPITRPEGYALLTGKIL